MILSLLRESFPALKESLLTLHQHGWLLFAAYLLLGWLAIAITGRFFRIAAIMRRIPGQVQTLLHSCINVLIWGFAAVQALHSVGVDIISVLGAAGVVGIAVGFASQTALSNVISGIFLLSEKSIKVGDYIRVEGQEGTVERINLLSLYLRHVDNALVRIPSQTLIQNPVVNVTGNRLRRCDFDIGVDYGSDLKQVREVIMEVVEEQALLADSPEPVVLFSSFADSSLNIHVGAWCKTTDYHNARFAFATDLLAAFKREGINIPFPTRSLFVQKQG